MRSRILQTYKILKLNPKRIFLVDSIGAFISALFLFFVLAPNESYFGMPRMELIYLSIIAFTFFIYSLSCYLFVHNCRKAFLNVIMIANILYCCLTVGLVLYHFPNLTIPGMVYFLVECMLIIGLVGLENRLLGFL
jgi:hypothetical protein